MKFTIQRWHEGTLVHEMTDLDLETTKGITTIVWGVVPDSMVSGGDAEEEWKLAIGEGHWVVIARTA